MALQQQRWSDHWYRRHRHGTPTHPRRQRFSCQQKNTLAARGMLRALYPSEKRKFSLILRNILLHKCRATITSDRTDFTRTMSRRENRIGTSPVSSTSNSGRTWRFCRKMNNTTFPTSFCLRVGKHKRLIAGIEFWRKTIIQRIFWNLLIAYLDPIDRVQPRSRTTCVGWWARSKGTDAIQAVVLE